MQPPANCIAKCCACCAGSHSTGPSVGQWPTEDNARAPRVQLEQQLALQIAAACASTCKREAAPEHVQRASAVHVES
eukprot:500674-Alexandrium_andersonii.AAC.1